MSYDFLSNFTETVCLIEYSPKIVQAQPRYPVVRVAQSPNGSQIRDARVFGLTRSKSPNDTNRDSSISPLPNPEIPNQYNHEPKTPTRTLGMGFDFAQDVNNNIVDSSQKIVYGLQSREVSVAVPPTMNNFNQAQQVQPQTRTASGFYQRHRFSSLTEHDWKEPLPIVNIPNTDQLLPSQTKQM